MLSKMDGNDNIMNTACAHSSAHPIWVMGSIMGESYHCYRPHYKTGVANMVGSVMRVGTDSFGDPIFQNGLQN